MSRPKGSKNKKNKKKSVDEVKSVVKRKVGRPKKVRDVGDEVKSVVKRKVGRPKKVRVEEKVFAKYTPSKYNNLPDDYVQPKTYKASGYCPRCDLCIMSHDFISKMIFECPRCQTRKHKKYLKDKSARDRAKAKEEANISKNEYLKEAASKIRDLEKQHGSSHHVSNVPDVSIMSEVENDS